MTRRFSWWLTLLMVLAVVVACAAPQAGGGTGAATSGESSTATTESSESAASEEPLKVILFINGVLGDKSFFDSAQRGVDRAKTELGIEADTIEAGLDQTAWEAALVDALRSEEHTSELQ